MDHVVYLDSKADELGKLLEGRKTMIIRGAAGRKLPYGRVQSGDLLYFVNNNGEGMVRAKAAVLDVVNSEKMDEQESAALVSANQDRLCLSAEQLRRWSGKRYLVLVSLSKVQAIEPFGIDKSAFGNMDDWLPVNDIESVAQRGG